MRGVLLLAALAGALPGCDEQSATGASQPGMVSVGDNFFSPRSVTPAPNGTVTWVWGGRIAHDVVFVDGSWSVPAIVNGVQMRDFSAHAPGTYPYFCSLHAGMTGEVVVP